MAEKKETLLDLVPRLTLLPPGPLSFCGLSKSGSQIASEPGEKPESKEKRTLTAPAPTQRPMSTCAEWSL